MGKMGDFRASKKPVFRQTFVTDRQTQDKSRWGPPPSRRKIVARGGPRARPPTPTNSLCPARKKWSTSSLFQPPHWSGRRFWGRPRGTLGRIPRRRGPSLWPPARGYPPFGQVLGIKCKQSSARKAPPFGRADARAWQEKGVLGELWSSAARTFFLVQKLAVLARHWAK